MTLLQIVLNVEKLSENEWTETFSPIYHGEQCKILIDHLGIQAQTISDIHQNESA